MWWHLSVLTMANRKLMSADNSLWHAWGAWCMQGCAAEGWDDFWRALRPVGFCAKISGCFLWKLKESLSQYSTVDLQRFRLPIYIFFNLTPFSVPLHAASPPTFSKSPLRALLKARSGSEVTLECKPQASPPAISLWKKGNEILQRTER